jgi:glycosyltransferase involved in cell wall biosynthesis
MTVAAPARPAVLMVENSLRENGGLRVSLEHARRFRLAGAPVRVAVLQDATDAPLARPDPAVEWEHLTARGSRMRTSALPALRRLVALARRSDVVVAGSDIGNCVLIGFAAARLARRPFVVLVQADLDDAITDWVPSPLRGVTRWIHRRVDAAVCVADSVAAGVVANGLPAERAHVVPNGIDVAAVRRRAGLPEDPAAQPPARPAHSREPTVIASGRLTAAKDFPLLIAAHERVRRAGCPHRLVILGEGDEREALEAAVAELGVGDSVSLPGFEPEPYGPIAAADLFVLSSRTEGLPLTVLEALAVGTPIIATRCGTGPDLLLDGGRYGDLVPVGDVDALAAAIEAHLRDPARLRRAACSGPARAMDFDAGRAADTVLALLGELAARRSGGERGDEPAGVARVDRGEDVGRQPEP